MSEDRRLHHATARDEDPTALCGCALPTNRDFCFGHAAKEWVKLARYLGKCEPCSDLMAIITLGGLDDG